MRLSFAALFLAASLAAVPAFAQSSATVKNVQQALKDKGFDPGPIDGRLGPQTRGALKKYQASQNLDADGRIGAKTLDSLGVKEASPKQQFKASGENVSNSYPAGGRDIKEGSKDMAHDVKDGHVGDGAVSFGKGVGSGVKKMAVGTGHAAKNVGKGVANAVTPDKDKKKDTQQ
ncbi:MAG TPA: peptidoglycan-binding domain-containing protein [Bryobacteraceae bacterium]|jgi:peptidoglycan hydrolase-like protein with peptidoglycan-binding domain|nr:peptidoglycan-binding domain-containing protein [Bryobacteraceae bacterium]